PALARPARQPAGTGLSAPDRPRPARGAPLVRYRDGRLSRHPSGRGGVLDPAHGRRTALRRLNEPAGCAAPESAPRKSSRERREEQWRIAAEAGPAPGTTPQNRWGVATGPSR